MGMAFRSEGSPLQEMKRLEALREQDPESAANMVANGKLLVEWARDGRLKELQCALDNMDEDRVVLFYSVRMFRVACEARRLDVLKFMLANGFDLQQAWMRDVLHGVVDAIQDETSADSVQPLIRFLLEAGVDVNWQCKGNFQTALHIACSKNLYGISYLLVLYGADVNAIASDDEMPLQSAERMALLGRTPTPADLAHNSSLLALLQDCGARRSWRKTKPPSDAANITDTSVSGSIVFAAPSLDASHTTGTGQPHQPPLQQPQPQPRIMSFSSATTHCSFSSMTRSVSGSPFSGADEGEGEEEEELLQAFSKGIQLDTPTATW